MSYDPTPVPSSSMDSSVRTRLSIMMFLQYFVWGSWGVEIGGYMGAVLGFPGSQIGWVYSSTAIAAMVSPLFMGYVADRLMSTEKLLAILHLAGAAVLAAAAYSGQIAANLQYASISQFEVLFGLMIVYSLLYMPTLALTNSISFANMSDPEKDFPMIRVFGTLGWIVAGWVVGFVLKVKPDSVLYEPVTSIVPADSAFFVAHNFMLLAAGASALLGLFCFSLPHTPPQASHTSAATSERRSILTLLADRSFLVFVVCSFLICIPLAFYYNLANLFLGETDAPYPTALQTVGQISEVFFMAMMPFFIKSLGVKRMLAIGMLAWVARYTFFASLSFPLVFVGLLLHGICYDFFFVASQIYVDTKADVSQRASAQSFIAFVTLGIGMFVGAMAAGRVLDLYPPEAKVAVVDTAGQPVLKDGKPVESLLPAWDPKATSGIAKALGWKAEDDVALNQLPEIITDPDSNASYRGADLAAALKAVDENQDGRVTRPEWRIAQRHRWDGVWTWPAVWAGVTLALFLLGFRDRVAAEKT